MKWKLPIAVVVVGGAAALVTFNPKVNARAREAIHKLAEVTSRSDRPGPETSPGREPAPRAPWDGLVHISDRQRAALGLETVAVEPQVEPLALVVNGATAYDPDTQSQIRPKAQSRVDRVYVNLGERITKGQKLVELSSSDLAETKTRYLEAQSQWERDKAQLARSEELFRQTPRPMISKKDYEEDINDERKSAQEFQFAKDRLEVIYGLTPHQIANLRNESSAERPKYTLSAPADGYVIKRDVVVQNIYDISSVLLVIAPLDKFWVWGNVYPSDANLVHVGQVWRIHCPSLNHDVTRTVEVITPQVDPDTKTIRIRTTLENIEGRVKADLLISGTLEVPPRPGSTTIPRVALVTADGGNFVFVQKADSPHDFERRSVSVVQEGARRVIVTNGLTPGEHVVTRGSLILAQMFEDASSTATGVPAL